MDLYTILSNDMKENACAAATSPAKDSHEWKSQNSTERQPFKDLTIKERFNMKKYFSSLKLRNPFKASSSPISSNNNTHIAKSTAVEVRKEPVLIEDVECAIIGQDLIQIGSPSHAVMGPSSAFEEAVNNEGFLKRFISRTFSHQGWTLFPVFDEAMGKRIGEAIEGHELNCAPEHQISKPNDDDDDDDE